MLFFTTTLWSLSFLMGSLSVLTSCSNCIRLREKFKKCSNQILRCSLLFARSDTALQPFWSAGFRKHFGNVFQKTLDLRHPTHCILVYYSRLFYSRANNFILISNHIRSTPPELKSGLFHSRTLIHRALRPYPRNMFPCSLLRSCWQTSKCCSATEAYDEQSPKSPVPLFGIYDRFVNCFLITMKMKSSIHWYRWLAWFWINDALHFVLKRNMIWLASIINLFQNACSELDKQYCYHVRKYKC